MSDFGADEFPAVNKIRTVAFVFLFAPVDKLKVDQHSTDDTDKVYHLVRRIGSTNLLVRVDPTQIAG